MTGRRSDTSLYDYNLATYDSGDSFDQKSSNGFIDNLRSAEPCGRSPRRQVRQWHRGSGKQRRVSEFFTPNRLDNGGERTVRTILTGILSPQSYLQGE